MTQVATPGVSLRIALDLVDHRPRARPATRVGKLDADDDVALVLDRQEAGGQLA